MSHTIEFISTHPIIAFIVMSIHLTVSVAIYELQLPIIVMQLFQIGAWSVTIIIGLITMYKFFKKK
jgi:hypothetical protein